MEKCRNNHYNTYSMMGFPMSNGQHVRCSCKINGLLIRRSWDRGPGGAMCGGDSLYNVRGGFVISFWWRSHRYPSYCFPAEFLYSDRDFSFPGKGGAL